jgi:hypothetical protein
LKKTKLIALNSFVSLLFFMLFSGCGSPPSSPPEIDFGALEIWAYIDSSWVDSTGTEHDSLLATDVWITLDDDSSTTVHLAVPASISGLLPGIHRLYCESGAYYKIDTVNIVPGDTVVKAPFMTKSPDFTLPAVHYDLAGDSVVHVDSVTLSDYRGEVVLLFYFTPG